MSLFRTLQSSPATVTIFHNTKIPLSNQLYDILNKTYDTLPEKPKYDFQIDLMQDKMPTYDQYETFVTKFLKSEQAKKTLHDAFPFVKEQETTLLNDKGSPITVKGAEWANKVFSSSEYRLLYDTFNQLEEKAGAKIATKPSDVFKAPLVVDWDQDKLAGDEQTLKELLAKYVDQ
ncbi:uncharacterized protein LODBEIA_P61350 [Lodderomyces beijingensis]|uniref:Uncharacterized protein n=1 Tax=Lodderomyces beijingensis TaxID=1775926 RepID=A0ABP0ZWD0_9ASCO